MAADGIVYARSHLKTHPPIKEISFFFFSLFLVLLVFSPQKIYNQETGFKYIRNFTPKDYDHYPQNLSIIQDQRGIIYVGNRGGLLEYDGVSWRKIKIPNETARSLAKDANGTIFIGGTDEFGYLAPGPGGDVQYVSLSERLEDDYKNFSRVWSTHSIKGGIYFRTPGYLFHWNNEQITVLPPDPGKKFNASFTCGGELYVRQDKIGLRKVVGNRIEQVPGGEIFADKFIFTLVPFNEQKLLIGTFRNGFFLYDGSKAEPFSTGADDYLEKYKLSYGLRLSAGDFALATMRGGVVIIGPQGRLRYIVNEISGLQDNYVNYVYEDNGGCLWLALNNSGVTKIEYSSPVSVYDKKSGLRGSVLSVIRHGSRNVLYAGTSSGLYYLAPPGTPGEPGQFRPVPGLPIMCSSLLSIDNSLLAATNRGMFLVGPGNNVDKTVLKVDYCFVLLRSKMDANRIWVGTRGGLFSLYREKDNWVEECRFEDITQEIRTITEDKKGNLWLALSTEGVIKIDFPINGTISNHKVTFYNKEGDPPLKRARVFWAADHVIFATDQRICRFDESKNVFLPDFTLGDEFAGGSKGQGVFRLIEDKDKNIWFHQADLRNVQAIPGLGGTLILNKKPFLRIPTVQVNVIYPDPDGKIVWFGSDEGLIRYDRGVKKNCDYEFPTLIRKIFVNGKPIFNGYKYKTGNGSKPGYHFPIIDYKDRNLRFEFAAPFFEDESMTEYQCLLKGYENDWSPWTSEPHKEYTNLDPATYTFRVRAKNIYRNKSNEAFFQFKVLPPWYKTWWALLFYTCALIMLVFFIVRWRSGKLEREKRKLEKIVEERTKEIKEKSRQLEQQTVQLQEQSEKLKEMDKVKSRFFANISHEFRTPLTLIMGPIEQMLSTTKDKEQNKNLNLMLGNSQRLLTLINQLLDLSRFDSGKMKLQAGRQNIIPFLKGILASFESLAEQNKIDLIFSTESEDIIIYFDPEKIEEVIINLISNAVKFTPAGGEIFVMVKTKPAREKNSSPGTGFLEISVRDTGPGIPKEQLEHIFDRFYQAGSASGNLPGFHHKGTGIGLALAKEAVELHHGKIDVHSSEGKGTEFIIQLPRGKEHLKPDEIVEISAFPPRHKKTVDISPSYSEEKAGEEIAADAEENEKDIDPVKEDKNVILVVEDNAEVRQYIRGPLKNLYQVKEAVNGREGIKLAKQTIPDLIISDIMMPEADGYELCRVLKQDVKTSHIPVILLTAKASEESVIQGLETGADDYITKPFNTRILLTRIQNLIDLRSQLQQKIQRELVLQPAEISVSSIDQEFIKELQDAIEKNLSDTLFGVEQLGKKLYMSRASLYRKIFALTGESPREFIKSYRLKRGAQLLKAGFGNVTEVAFETGFSSTSYFIKCFKEKFQQSPHTFQASESAGKEPDST